LIRPKFDLDFVKNCGMTRFLVMCSVEMTCRRTKNAGFLCSSVNSWLAMKNCGMTRFLVTCSAEMTCRRTRTRTMRMT
jgi:hypothetical protein